uniref:AP-3 complex subunit beta n=1 Tax=Trichuris muris TaxID=70415 RepID=A0A5S6QMZ7_TRIMR
MPYTADAGSPEVEIASDAFITSFLTDPRRRHFDLREMLDSNKDGLKIEAMKRIINLVARGKEASDLFAAVVKNVASKNPELKKLVYLYLTRYGEEQQDLALLSISTFQKALKDPNQLIRASALRVLSSIRVPIIVPIMMLVIRESARDMSPYVRKVAAHAIPKLYQLDADQKDQLVDIISQLLGDMTTLVIGSAVNAFEEVCPERFDLIHKHYRKLCALLIDVDEWGQVTIINMFTRYARAHFTDPNRSRPTSDSEMEDSTSEESDSAQSEKSARRANPADPDLTLLLTSAKPLLQSRNSAVVLAVAQLFYYLAPKEEVNSIARPLVRLLRSYREMQFVVLTCIASISTERSAMFEPFLKSFFVRSSDAIQVKLLKLEILTNIAKPSNIGVILRELQTYVMTFDKDFTAETINAIGRCACNIEEVRDSCLKGLVSFMANPNDLVVAQSVIVIKNLLQHELSHHRDIIVTMAKLFDKVQVPTARASILWLVGEYNEEVPFVAPDVLRKVARTFAQEEEVVKLQAVNLAVKLLLRCPAKTELLADYVLNLARYDQSYDIRDRVRFLRNLLNSSTLNNRFTAIAKRLCCVPKPVPSMFSGFVGREPFQLGTLSHLLNQRCVRYNDLPPFAEIPSDPSLRDVGESAFQDKGMLQKLENLRQAHPAMDSADFDEIPGEAFEDSASSDEGSSEDGTEQESDGTDDSESDSTGETEDSEDEFSESSTEIEPVGLKSEVGNFANEARKASLHLSKVEDKSKETAKHSAKPMDLLIDVDDFAESIGVVPLAPSQLVGSPLRPSPSPNGKLGNRTFPLVAASYFHEQGREIVNKVAGRGVRVTCRFTRVPHLSLDSACSVELQLHNQSERPIELVRLLEQCPSNIQVYGLSDVSNLQAGRCASVTLGICFGDSTQPVSFTMAVDDQVPTNFSFTAPVGEQLQPIELTVEEFTSLQIELRGLNENQSKLTPKVRNSQHVQSGVLRMANVYPLSSTDDTMRFSAQTLAGKQPLLISIRHPEVRDESQWLTVNCENVVICSILFKQLKAFLE